MSIVVIVLVAVAVLLIVQLIVVRRAGYKIGGAVRLGLVRFQYCPVGDHWALVTPVNEADLTDEEKRLAAENRDTRVP